VIAYPNSALLTMFDDHCCQITGGGTYVSATGPSRGLVLKLDLQSHTATMAGQYSHGSGFEAEYMGNLQPLPGGNEFVGWGSASYLTEYDVSGHELLDAKLPSPDLTYRSEVEPWVGLPLYPPAGAARRLGAKTTVYASWNGATQVASWKVLGGPSAGQLSAVATRPKAGFETAIPVAQSDSTFKLEALDSGGAVIGTSAAFTAAG
jgi:hypothetical protein